MGSRFEREREREIPYYSERVWKSGNWGKGRVSKLQSSTHFPRSGEELSLKKCESCFFGRKKERNILYPRETRDVRITLKSFLVFSFPLPTTNVINNLYHV